jgi:hypothetical protein
METSRFPGRIRLFVGAVALVSLMPVAPAGADGNGGGRQGRVEVTFTKWVLNGGFGPFMEGVTGGDIDGVFLGEVFENVKSARIPSLVNRLEVIYEVQAGDRSFTSLLQGGQYKPGGVPLGGTAQFDGFVLAGWRRGAQVHAEWTSMQGPVNCPSPPVGAGALCFVGTITIERPDHDDDH